VVRSIDEVVKELVLSDDLHTKEKCLDEIWAQASDAGIYPASIQELYAARGQEKFKGVSVPAMNLRALAYDSARAVFRAAKKINAGAFIMEIAKSEMGYTNQRPCEYVGVCLAAAVKEGHKGPVFIQGDHFQVNAKKFKEDPKKEVQGVKDIIREAIASGFYNIDIDTSTLVELEKPTVNEQQKLNYEVCAELTKYIRSVEPKGINVSVGGEIGEVGTKNSTVEDLDAFMTGYLAILPKGVAGISKMSVQTGTSHGGVVLPDGSVAKVKLDFNVLKEIGVAGRKKYGLSGAVQHGASTLPDEAFHNFPAAETAEVHLATGFQNMIFESKNLPEDLRQKMYAWLHENAKEEMKAGMTEEQFIYKARKKAIGPFKKEMFSIPMNLREAIGQELEAKFSFLFTQLNIRGSKDLVATYVTDVRKVPRAAGLMDIKKGGEMSSEGAD